MELLKYRPVTRRIDRDVLSGEVIIERAADAHIEVNGSVFGDGAVIAIGGAATVTILGNVSPQARVGAQGGGARVVIHGSIV